MKKMKTFVMAFVGIFAAIQAFAWTPEEINSRAYQTNFQLENWCSATLISREYRLILTANHCVRQITGEKRDMVAMTQFEMDGSVPSMSRTWYATVVDTDSSLDLALLQINKGTIPQTEESPIYNGSVPMVGETTYVIGNPYMLYTSVTKGIISSVHRRLSVGANTQDYYQTDANILPGNSGGAVYNDEGQLIGVSDAAIPGQVGLFVPYTDVQNFLRSNCYASLFDDSAESYEQCKGIKTKKEDDNKVLERAIQILKNKGEQQ